MSIKKKDETFEDPALSMVRMQVYLNPLNNMPVFIHYMAIFIVIFYLVFLALAETKIDIYVSAMWDDIKDNNSKRFVDDTQSLIERLKLENTILVDTMPRPKEASTNSMNNYLKLLLDELLKLYNGVKLSDNSNENITICAITMIPKTTQVDFSGFEYSTRTKRTKAGNLDYANKWKEAKNAAERTRLERSNGT
ncbi:hypothetical protein PHYBLDRAFT_141115 [Phycomyces blakesleeanus NRRL 1555(-)]|uniref:Uncharacterized protein n=1 Tax=Phycomyces blakesleeanus (strain ATCC 8743b / DSM 1359 / FGSC 10004 / NBRC 33097 / NRRL 1555) TaxID=763407 RepID=A0A163B9S4_PHYB8|nr:hypothetical protein PHYBLDRAFT_141115 [Phycomyces blakesleeanus NRRL 1555(-)]OAD79061.1 hypothetical protein PHYBLDRAFT_141115 [Phycomyces blakesleeanus NRRL 1555(-)]|eukprot:XP_018297101.1 hypothetical protein PHYBLDRAFT_141115 [Phycomyces blakesleeanus NRRL 1555(-)]